MRCRYWGHPAALQLVSASIKRNQYRLLIAAQEHCYGKTGRRYNKDERVFGIAIETLEEIYVRARKFEKMRLNIAPSQVAFTGGSK